MFQLFGKKILLKKPASSTETKTSTGLYVPTINPDDSNTLLAEVDGIGPEVTQVKVGDKLYFHKFDAKQFTHERTTYWVILEESILTKVE